MTNSHEITMYGCNSEQMIMIRTGNRLVEVKNSSDALLAQYGYNGLNQRIRKTINNVVTESFFNINWRELEYTEPGAAFPLTTYVWGLRYIDDLVLRERDTEKLYSLADPNWNVVCLADALGSLNVRVDVLF